MSLVNWELAVPLLDDETLFWLFRQSKKYIDWKKIIDNNLGVEARKTLMKKVLELALDPHTPTPTVRASTSTTKKRRRRRTPVEPTKRLYEPKRKWDSANGSIVASGRRYTPHPNNMPAEGTKHRLAYEYMYNQDPPGMSVEQARGMLDEWNAANGIRTGYNFSQFITSMYQAVTLNVEGVQ